MYVLKICFVDAGYWMLGAGALGRPRGSTWGGRREEGSGWGTHVYLWRIHFDIWQKQYSIVKLKNKIQGKKKENMFCSMTYLFILTMASFVMQKSVILMQANVAIICFMICFFWVFFK